MNILTPTEAAARLGLTRQAFQQSILPLLIQRGEVRRLGRAWAIDGKDFWMWELYASTRKNLIEAGVWIARRPWSVSDFNDITGIGMYEDYQPTGEERETTMKKVCCVICGKEKIFVTEDAWLDYKDEKPEGEPPGYICEECREDNPAER